MAKTLTKAQLASELEASHVAYEKLAAQNASIMAQIVALQAPKKAEPAAKDAARAPKADISCPKCAGTGTYGDDGICFQCEGKGFQNDADQRRNWGYRRFHQAAVAPKAAQPARKPTVQMGDRAAAIKAYFAANPGARSVTPEQLAAFQRPAPVLDTDYEDEGEDSHEYDMADVANWS